MSPNSIKNLENESIEIIREVVANSKSPVLLYSIGKDSGTLLHLASKAFYPGKIPFPLLHIDSTFEFRETVEFKNNIKNYYDVEIITYKNEEAIKDKINPFNFSSSYYTEMMRTIPLKEAISKYKFDGIIGGARRDEEKSRAKERIFSLREENHTWEPRNQRPELWSLYNAHLKSGQTMRVFPLSNWTEMDIWMYIKMENIPIPSVYFSKLRPTVERDGKILCVDDNRMAIQKNEKIEYKNVRFRTCGCYPLTAGIFSHSTSIDDIILELLISQKSEREGRLIDHDSASAMEIKKRSGYF